MEYTQWVQNPQYAEKHWDVLILVVMEYTQWVKALVAFIRVLCLNPCCNGIYSMRV